ncbi:MAG: hypothetical protein A2020_14770 [Lentisphaerae bacterium GWF2_45_14]|nr:MAG: hypothetical protein A2020_14770 [Lentisphaerae bacterium GWF2_45_14]
MIKKITTLFSLRSGNNELHDANYDLIQPGDTFTSTANHLLGVKLQNEFLMLDMERTCSYRVKCENLLSLAPFSIERVPHVNEITEIEKYFETNCDNPFAVYNVYRCIVNHITVNKLTQFPPLYFNKSKLNRKDELAKMNELANTGDTVFTYIRNSRISQIIRQVDRGPWSHVGVVGEDKNISEMTTVGMRKSNFSDYISNNADVALYRSQGALNQNQKNQIIKVIESIHASRPKYGWGKILAIFLNKRLNLPIPITVTPADLIYANNLQLIHFC